MCLARLSQFVTQRLHCSRPISLCETVKASFAFVLLTSALTITTGLYAQDDVAVQSRIVGGNVAEDGEWPSLVALIMPGVEPLKFRQFCGGSVIADRWVLTAAHCLFNVDGSPTTADQIRIVAGINNLNDVAAVETVVTNIFVHPQYDNPVFPVNDIALLELSTSVPVPQNSLLDVDPELLVGRTAFIVGWGALTEEGPMAAERFPGLLQDASMPIVSREQCNLPESYNGNILTTQLCAGFRQGGVDSCQGDSGGPIYVLEGSRQVQIGITSFGAGCARPNLYGVYTNVNAFRPWMSNYINLSGRMVSESAIGGLAAASGAISVGAGDVAGSTHPLILSLLASFTMLLLMRKSLRRCGCKFGCNCKRGSHSGGASTRNQKLFLLFTALVLASACSSNLPLPEDNDAPKTISSENNSTVIDADNERVLSTGKLSLSGDNGKVGLNQLQLGSTRLESEQALISQGFDVPDCDVDKTSIKGTGRLFLREICRAQPLGKLSLEGLDVDLLIFQILDDRLVKLEANMQSGNAMSLTRQLNVRYEHTPSAQWPFEWRLGDNHIRIVASDTSAADGISGISLQMIDGRLKDKLPKLFDYP
ncbi:MAG: hypothetical protein ACI8UP_003064 [Porticoccaceae bacterium]|jgi:hypothetical protein